jgi:hypothetical protein
MRDYQSLQIDSQSLQNPAECDFMGIQWYKKAAAENTEILFKNLCVLCG